MKTASEFRLAAREALKGKWWLAVGVGVVASILGGGSGDTSPNINIELPFPNGSSDTIVTPDVNTVNLSWESFQETFANVLPFFVGIGAFALLVALVMGIAYFVLGSIVGVGYAKFNLNLIDRREATFGNLFAYFSAWKRTAIASLLRTLYILLWCILFVIPGIIAYYSYAMTDYILAEEPSLSASEAIERSKMLMDGNRWRLFCLNLSFIGWDLLCALFTFGIGYLWLTPYKRAAIADFYREISDTRPVPETDELEYPNLEM